MKNKSIKLLSILLTFIIVFSLVACGQDEPAGDGAFTAGKYTATASGHNGDLTVEVEFDESSILSVVVTDHSESAGIADVPLERIPDEIVDNQTLAVDSISGATATSEAILVAVEDAVLQAGGDVDALKAAAGNDGEQEDITLDTDVVVVGAGGTGLAAAASAHENGAKVVVLEKLANVGGSTALSGGGISATGTRFQEEIDVEDTKESWMELWKERQATSNPDAMYPDYDIVDNFMDEAVETTHWMVDYINHKYGSVTGFGLDPVARIHFPEQEEGKGGGSVLIGNMEKFIRDEGIDILLETAATELIVDDNGDVTGVIAESNGGKVTVNAKKVILATGGYAKNDELLERFVPEAAGTAGMSAASAGHTGDGLLMAEELGAAIYEEPWVIGLGISSKIDGLGLGMDWTRLWVNQDGERFANEEVHYAIATNELLEQEETWMILDSSEENSELTALLENSLDTDEVVKADDFAALAEEMNVNGDTFAETMESFNTGVNSGDDKMGKDPEMLVAVDTAPYYAVKFYPYTMGTFAGVKVDENYQVVNEDGTVISNLYAGGEMSNKALYNQVYMSGSAVQYALTSGRLAGEHAAQNLN